MFVNNLIRKYGKSMSVIKEPIPKSFEKMLSNSKYEIPYLQRDYDWNPSELKKFWKDAFTIYENDVDEYFVGPMVFVEKNDNVFQVIDGQQRLLTMSILATAARDILIKVFGSLDYQLEVYSIRGLF